MQTIPTMGFGSFGSIGQVTLFGFGGAVTPGVVGPFRSVAGQAFSPGSVLGQYFAAGSVAAQGIEAGSINAQFFTAGSVSAQAKGAGSTGGNYE